MDWGETMNSEQWWKVRTDQGGEVPPARQVQSRTPTICLFPTFWWEIHLGRFSEAFPSHFEGLLLVSFPLAFRNILPSLFLEYSFPGNVQNGGMQTFWVETVWPESERDIYWFSRGMGILYSTSNSNQWSSQNTGNLREMLVWKRNQTLCLNYVTPFSC